MVRPCLVSPYSQISITSYHIKKFPTHINFQLFFQTPNFLQTSNFFQELNTPLSSLYLNRVRGSPMWMLMMYQLEQLWQLWGCAQIWSGNLIKQLVRYFAFMFDKRNDDSSQVTTTARSRTQVGRTPSPILRVVFDLSSCQNIWF